ncbi:hypothetical protein [Metabacillus sediminilitoris]|uniref:hypothetical protein n=1 Tax=Metabacillus sediminilitoris TaxID=2567941 RepID=UPI001B3B245B|nr:hypothetical protein [Metabacillus sediminilitoris]
MSNKQDNRYSRSNPLTYSIDQYVTDLHQDYFLQFVGSLDPNPLVRYSLWLECPVAAHL